MMSVLAIHMIVTPMQSVQILTEVLLAHAKEVMKEMGKHHVMVSKLNKLMQKLSDLNRHSSSLL